MTTTEIIHENYSFAEALHALEKSEGIYMRRKEWNVGTYIYIAKHKDPYSPHLAVVSNKGNIPWIPTQVEMVINKDWEVLNYVQV